MRWKRLGQSIEYMATVFKWISYISAGAAALGSLFKLFDWGKQGSFANPFTFLKTNIQILWLSALTAAALTVWIWTSRLQRRFVDRFSDNFTGDLHANWDFVGPWRVAEKNTLLVTGSDAGGITKVGAQWENYAFTFKAHIVRECLGVIVRAQDLNNYYMFQIRTDKIHPHRRVAYPVIDTAPPTLQEALTKENVTINPIKFQIGWEKFDPPTPVHLQLNGWFDAKITVRGESISIYIDGNLVFQEESFLKIPTGKVGFRNDGHETAFVRNVRVTIQS